MPFFVVLILCALVAFGIASYSFFHALPKWLIVIQCIANLVILLGMFFLLNKAAGAVAMAYKN